MSEQQLKLFHVTEYEILAAHTTYHALKLYRAIFPGDSETNISDVVEIIEAELDQEFPELDNKEEETGDITTLRKILSAITEPGLVWSVS
jgi:hypothetical protein